MGVLYKLINSLLSQFGFFLIRNELRSDLPSLIRSMKKAGVDIRVVYDVGAYRGKWTEGLKPYLHKNALFFLFEPNAKYDSELRRTGHPVYRVLLSNKSKVLTFYSQEGAGDSYYPEKFLDGSVVKERNIQTTTLDEMFADASNNLMSPDLMKIDTQGSELDILQGSKSVIQNLKVLILECPIIKYNQGAPDIQEYLDTVIKLGFVPFKVIEIHTRHNVFVQIDIAFVSKQLFESHFVKLDMEGFWQNTREFYGI